MTLETLMIITVVIAALAMLSTHLFRQAGSPYLLTITGTRAQLIVTGALIWVGAIAAGLVGLLIVSSIMSNVVAIAVFFGIEAVALDICAHRIKYQRQDHPRLVDVRVNALNRHHAS
jgi:hypothetical protein